MGQIWDFLRSVSVHFGSPSQNVLKLILKSTRFVPLGANLTQFGCHILHSWPPRQTLIFYYTRSTVGTKHGAWGTRIDYLILFLIKQELCMYGESTRVLQEYFTILLISLAKHTCDFNGFELRTIHIRHRHVTKGVISL